MNSRGRVLTALRHQEPDRIPIDFNGMASTGIMAIAYNRLVDHLGLPGGNTYLYDIGQQLATPEETVLDRFGVDVRPLSFSGYQDPLDPQWKLWTLPDGSSAWVPVEFNPVQNEAGDWEIINEANFPACATWQNEMVKYVKSYEAGKPKQHLVGITAGYRKAKTNELLRSGPADWISPSARDGRYDYRIRP